MNMCTTTSGADSTGGTCPPHLLAPTFTNTWAWGHREKKNNKQETDQTSNHHKIAHQNDCVNYTIKKWRGTTKFVSNALCRTSVPHFIKIRSDAAGNN